MKHLLAFVLALTLLTACDSEPTYIDNGNLGQIKVIVFYDDNKNGMFDDGESGTQIQEVIGIAQEISCPPSSTPSYMNTDANGVLEFNELKPGKYCLYLNNGFNPVTKFTQEVYVSSDMITNVYFGLGR